MINGHRSMWIQELPARPPAQQVRGAVETEYAVIGGGLSGLWTAYALKQLRPQARVAVFEAHRVGDGASGRACGWLSGKPVGVRDVLARVRGVSGVQRTETLLRDSLEPTMALFEEHGAAIGAHHGGSLLVARSASEAKRVEQWVTDSLRWGVPEDRLRLLDAHETADRVEVSRAVRSAFSPDMVRVDPARMTVALGEIVRGLGVDIFEHSPVTFAHGQAFANGHPVMADRLALATEAYTAKLAGFERRVLPMNSSLVATRPLTDAEWDRVGWAQAEGLSGAAHTYFYAARTPDGRIALGGRGKAYRYGSGFDREGVVDAATVRSLERLLRDLFPQVSLDVEYAWCGVIGVARDWSPFVTPFSNGNAVTMGGYVGQGLAASRLAGRIAASILTGTDDEYVELPWVRDLPRKWEPEPLRWVGANGLYQVYSLADVMEHRRDSPRTAWVTKVADRIGGRSSRPFPLET